MLARENDYLSRARAMGIFDARCWLGGTPGPRLPTEPRASCAAELVALLDRAGIARGVAFHALARSSRPSYGNRILLEELAGQVRLLPGAVLSTDDTGPDTIGELVRRGARLACVYPASHGFSLEAWCSGDVLASLEAHRLPVVIPHTEAPWSVIRRVCLAYPELPVLVEGGQEKLIYHSRTFRPLLAECPNLRLLLHGLVGWRLVDELAACHGATRLLFASHLPLQDPQVAVGLLAWALMPASDVARIACENLSTLVSEVREC